MRRAVFSLTAACVITILMLTIAQVTVVKANPFNPMFRVHSPNPLPTIYTNPNVDISFDYSIENYSTQIDSFSFSLDKKANITLSFKTSQTNMSVRDTLVEGTKYSVSKPLENLANGDHTLTVYAHYSNETIRPILNTTFTVDTTVTDPFTPCIISPQNQTTYNTTQVPLTYAVNKILRSYYSVDVLWSYYSIDDSDLRYHEGNITLPSLSEGQHKLTLAVAYTVSRSNLAYQVTTQTIDTIFFYVDDVAPKITNVSIGSTDTSNLLLNFTVDENTSWVGYSLDNQANVTVNAETVVLGELPIGYHNVTVYAKDAAGNVGVSEILFFSVGATDLNAAIPDLYTIIAIIAIVIAVISTGLFVYFRRTRKG
jgi:hypothetical protein